MNTIKNAKRILDSYEANENLGDENLLHSATYALIAIAEQLEKMNDFERLNNTEFTTKWEDK